MAPEKAGPTTLEMVYDRVCGIDDTLKNHIKRYDERHDELIDRVAAAERELAARESAGKVRGERIDALLEEHSDCYRTYKQIAEAPGGVSRIVRVTQETAGVGRWLAVIAASVVSAAVIGFASWFLHRESAKTVAAETVKQMVAAQAKASNGKVNGN